LSSWLSIIVERVDRWQVQFAIRGARW